MALKGASLNTQPLVLSGHNMVPGWTPSRVDQGVDGTLTSDGFVAPWKCKVLRAVGFVRSWEGGWTVVEILEGPLQGQGIYIAEGAVCNFMLDAVVPAGAKLCNRELNAFFNPPLLGNIEAGFVAPNANQPLAQTFPGYPFTSANADQSVQAITAGEAFDRVIGALGGARGRNYSSNKADYSLLPSTLRAALKL